MIRRRLTPDEIVAAAGSLDETRTLTDVVGTLVAVDAPVDATVGTETGETGEAAETGTPDTDGPDVPGERQGTENPHETGLEQLATLVIEAKHGVERVALGDVVAMKELGPRPVRRGAPHRAISVLDLEELMVDGWVPRERDWMGRWLLRASDGYTGRANSCLVLGEPDQPLDEALTTVSQWYTERGLPPLLQVALAPGFDADEDDLVQEASALGWEPFLPVSVMTASANVVAQATGTAGAAGNRVDDATIDVATHITDAWWALADERAREHEDAARRIFTASRDQRLLTLSEPGPRTDDAPDGDHGSSTDETRSSGRPLAHARLALSPGWGGIFVLATHPGARRRGLARRLVAACAREAADAGAASLYLQVAADNDAAIALYESMGFTTHHTYVYLRPV